MARRRRVAPDKGEFVSKEPIPDWMELKADREIDPEVTEYLTKRAAYIGSCLRPRDQQRLDWLINSHWPLGAKSIAEWNELMRVYYSTHALEGDETHHTPSDDAKAKAHCLNYALSRLLELVGAPPVVISDLRALLSGYDLKGATSYSRVQRELLVNNTASYRRMATKAGIDQSEITQAIEAGHLIDPWREGRS